MQLKIYIYLSWKFIIRLIILYSKIYSWVCRTCVLKEKVIKNTRTIAYHVHSFIADNKN